MSLFAELRPVYTYLHTYLNYTIFTPTLTLEPRCRLRATMQQISSMFTCTVCQ